MKITQKVVLVVGMLGIGSSLINLLRADLTSTDLIGFICVACLIFEVIRPKENVKEIE